MVDQLGSAVDASQTQSVHESIGGLQIVEGNTLFVAFAGGSGAIDVTDDVRDERVLWDTHWAAASGVSGGISQKTASADWPENPLPVIDTTWSPANARKAMTTGFFEGNARQFFGANHEIFEVNGNGRFPISMETLEYDQDATIIATLAIKLGNNPLTHFACEEPEGFTPFDQVVVPAPPAPGLEQRVLCVAWGERPANGDRVVTFNVHANPSLSHVPIVMTTAIFFDAAG